VDDYSNENADDLGLTSPVLVSARNHDRTMAYERCVRKKLQSLFEYLDTDNDNRITLECLLRGFKDCKATPPPDKMISVALLLAHRMEMNLVTTTTHADMCEYEVEELIRCVPKADASGQIT
jgi:hypothetical protein